MKISAALLLVVLSASHYAQEKDEDSRQDAICSAYKEVPLPAEATSFPQPKIFPACESYKLYSGIGEPKDYTAARQCAWQERLAMNAKLPQNPKASTSYGVGGTGILMELYANGLGLKRNLPLALRLGCEDGIAESALDDLAARIKDSSAAKKPFDSCDFATTTFEIGFCVGYHSEITDDRRLHALNQLSASWPTDQKRAFAALIQADAAYAEGHGRGELNTEGTDRAYEGTFSEEILLDAFTFLVRTLEKGQFPSFTAKDAVLADQRLEGIYKRNLASAEKKREEYGAVDPGKLRETQDAWTRYRDAWMVFGRLRYPKMSPESLRAKITWDRVRLLRETCFEIDYEDQGCGR